MAGRQMSRRFVIGVLGSSVAAVPLIMRTAAAAVPPPAPGADALIAPLGPGARFGRWVVRRVEPISRGAVNVMIAGEDGHEFRVEILARDTSPLAPRPPASTARFALHVCNGGDGGLATCEEQGLAAMALAEVVAANEAAIDASGFLTHAERLEHHGDALLSEPPGAARSRG
ncbi:MAG: hypothetical protein IT372_31370 [Polyangiaceae bacterium]|nr:hypothetical protein [Polyangiaceae bacterium]